jgi:hypothetical protein
MTNIKGWDTIDALRNGETITARINDEDLTYRMEDWLIYKLAKNGTWQRVSGAKEVDNLLSFEFEIIPAIPEPEFDLDFPEAYRMLKMGRRVVNDLDPRIVYYLEDGKLMGTWDTFDLAEIESKWRVVK